MSDKTINNVKLYMKWTVPTSSDRPGENAGTDGYVNENLSDTIGKIVKYVNDIDSTVGDINTVLEEVL